jgi:tight adherence protein C
MPIYLVLTFFAAVTIAIAAFGYERYAKAGRVYEHLGQPGLDRPADAEQEVQKPREFKLLQTIGKLIPSSPEGATVTRRMLSYAGYRSDYAVQVVFGLKAVGAVALGVLGLLFRDMVTSNPILRIIFPVGVAVAGYMLPGFLLDRAASKRQTKLRHSLPDALDLMVIAVEAGLGLDQAVKYVSTELYTAHKDLAEELSLVNLEIRAGKRRSDALKHLADRNGERELRKLTAILIQNDRFGTSIAESLRAHSDFMRVRRRQQAEERAAKVGVKLVFPIFFFILPAMMMVCAGPAVLQVVKYMLPIMKSFGS